MSKLTQVDFYATQLADFSATLPLVSRIALKAYENKQSLFIHCQTEAQAKQVDDFLWTFSDINFIPHALLDVGIQENNPILIGYTNDLPTEKNILLNLTDATQEWQKDFNRIIEIVHEGNKENARERYKLYKSLRLKLNLHKI